MDYQYQTEHGAVVVRVEAAASAAQPAGAGAAYRVTVGGRVFEVEQATLEAGELRLTIAGRRLTIYVAADGPHRWVALGGETRRLSLPQAETKRRRAAGGRPQQDTQEAQMPGVVRQVLAQPGDRVERGQPLLVLEAMKMEIKITAPHTGQVTAIAVRAGEIVQRGQLLADLAPEGD